MKAILTGKNSNNKKAHIVHKKGKPLKRGLSLFVF